MSVHQLSVIDPKTRSAFRAWLRAHHTQIESVWVTVYKKGCDPSFLSRNDVVDEVLCFGWIDSRPKKLNSEAYLLLVSPRRPKSVWSAINKRKIILLIANGKMTTHGLAKINEAKRNGSWNALNRSDRLELPAALKNEFAKNKAAKQKFDAFPVTARRAILEWIYSSKTAVTRTKRVRKTVAMSAKGLKANLS